MAAPRQTVSENSGVEVSNISGSKDETVKAEFFSFTKEALEFCKAAQESKVLGISVCSLNPSGCFDIAKGISAQFSQSTCIEIQYTISNDTFSFISSPALIKSPTAYKTVFFTGCNIDFKNKLAILDSLSKQYQFSNIKQVYDITPCHRLYKRHYEALSNEEAHAFKERSSYQYARLHSGIDTNFLPNIGIPRFVLKESTFEVPSNCYGLIRHRFLNKFPPSKKYLNEYFSQVASAGKENTSQPVVVMALGIELAQRQRYLDVAERHHVTIDFCDRLPQQDFFKVLTAMKDKKGIVSLNSCGTQSLLQALSFQAPVMLYPCIDEEGAIPYSRFYKQLVRLFSYKHRLTVQVILGLNDNYDVFKNRERCQQVYDELYAAINKSHERFEAFKASHAIDPKEKEKAAENEKAMLKLISNTPVIASKELSPPAPSMYSMGLTLYSSTPAVDTTCSTLAPHAPILLLSYSH